MDFTMYSGFSELIARKGAGYAADYAAKTGFASVEFLDILVGGGAPMIQSAKEAAEIRSELQSRGLGVACYSAAANIWKKETAEETFRKALEIAAELGSLYFHHTLLSWLAPPAEAPSFEEGIKAAVEAAAGVADYAKTLGITCIYEDQGQYINGVEGFGAFYWELKKSCSNVGVCGDLGNIFFVNESPQNFLEAFQDEICHVHVKDYLRKNSAESPGAGWLPARDHTWLYDTEVGNGIIDFNACLKILKEAGYAGPYFLEIPAYEPFSERAKRTMAYLRKLY